MTHHDPDITGGPEPVGPDPGDREPEVLEAVVSLVDHVLHDFDIVELLTDLSERCVLLLDVVSAGLLLGDARSRLHLMAATSGRTHDLELFQLQADEGPCLDCYTTGRPVSVADLELYAARWPQFGPAATDAGFASVHAVPLRAAGLVVGALGLFGTETGELTDADLLVAQTLAHLATVAIVQEQAPSRDAVLPQLRGALTSRIVVEQAKGFLRGELGVTVDEAFSLLRRYAVAHARHLTDVARALVSDRLVRPDILAGIRALADRAAG